MRLMPIMTGEILYANAWFSLTCLIVLNIVRKARIVITLVRNEKF